MIEGQHENASTREIAFSLRLIVASRRQSGRLLVDRRRRQRCLSSGERPLESIAKSFEHKLQMPS